MDSRTILDHALFQLTPTRTRCDLVIFNNGGGNEKLASGLLAPFLNHLQSAKDQISKGGYSITLRPSSGSDSSHWFTKSTLQRFVRFVNQPEVLERFVTLEKEIVQIENSIQSNELANNGTNGVVQPEASDGNSNKANLAPKPKEEGNGATADAAPEENSKVRLQRVLESRRAVLCKEQAMAYARALVAGFEPGYLDELIAFADAFGASRLREGCINFMELCKQKNEDRRWMAELAAMQACPQPVMPYMESSGIILAGEDCDPTHGGLMINLKPSGGLDTSISDSTASHGSFEANQENGNQTQTATMDGKGQVWAGQFPPQFMPNFQGPMFHPYQPYMFPGMHYPPNMKWPPPNMEDSGPHFDREPDRNTRSRRSHKKKQQHSNEESESSYESESEEEEEEVAKKASKKKKKKNESRKVVIRNINYISSKRDEDSAGSGSSEEDDDEYIDGDSIKQQVEEAVGSLERRRRQPSSRRNKKQGGNANGVGSSTNEVKNADNDDDIKEKRPTDNWAAFQNLLMRDDEPRSAFDEQPRGGQDYFSEEGKALPSLGFEQEKSPKQRAVSSDDFLVTGRDPGIENTSQVAYFEGSEAATMIKKQHSPGEEEFMLSRVIDSESARVAIPDGVEPSKMKCPKDSEWFVGDHQDPLANPGQSNDPNLFDRVYSSTGPNNNRDMPIADDSFIVQDRFVEDQSDPFLIIAAEIAEPAQFQYENDEKNEEAFNGHEPDDLFMMLDRDSGVEQQTLDAWTPEMDYNNIVSMGDKKDVNESEANESVDTKSKAKTLKGNGVAGKGKPDLMSRAKRPGLISRTTTGPKTRLEREEENRRKLEEQRLERQRRIAERSAGKGPATAAAPPLSRRLSAEKSQPATTKAVLRSSTIDRLSAARNPVSKAPSPTSQTSGLQRKQPANANSLAVVKKPGLNKPKALETEAKNKKPSEVKPDDKKAINPVVAEEILVSKIAEDCVSEEVKEVRIVDPVVESSKEENVVIAAAESPILVEEHKKEETVESSPTSTLSHGPPSIQISAPLKEESLTAKTEENEAEIEEVSEILEIETSTPPAELGNSESPHSRKKWNSEEPGSPKAASKGFRKLLLFGRKSKTTAVN